MKKAMLPKKSAILFLVSAAAFALARPAQAQEASASARVPVRVTVTAMGPKGEEAPELTKQDILVHQEKQRDPVIDWVPAQGDQAGLQLVILIDDASRTELGSQLGDIRDFIQMQGLATKVAVAYAENGGVQMVQNFTTDKDMAAKAVRIPLGYLGASSSIWFSLSDLISRWPPSNDRREVLLVADGINRLRNAANLVDPDMDDAVQKAQKAGVVVHTIYARGVGYASRNFFIVNIGQSKLGELANATGGEEYFEGVSTLISFSPYLKELTNVLNHQYLLTFGAYQEAKSKFYRIKVTTETHGVDLGTQDQVYVPGTGAKK
jgi:hypothetical protein